MLKNRNITICLMILLLFSTTFLYVSGCSEESVAPSEEEQEEVDDEEEEVKEEEEEEEKEEKVIIVEKVKPITVIINNHPSARPQSGMQEASIVYEFLVEGEYTRFLAVYDTLYTENYLIGPVRSLRPYFGVKAAEHGGIIAHSGYSNRTAEMIRGLGLKQIVCSTYLWRDSSRRAPHNLYTDIEKLHQAVGSDLEVTKSEITPEEVSLDSNKGNEIEVTYNSRNIVTYEYDDKKGAYLRFINNTPHKDRETEKQYHTSRVIIQKVPHRNVSGTDLVDIDLAGSGEGMLYEESKKYTITWKKEDGETNYYYRDGTPVELEPGNTWIQIVR